MFLKTSSCFTNQMFYVRNIPICSYTINKITFIINTITTIIIIFIIFIIIFNFNITIIIIIIISIIIDSTLSSSFSVSFSISSTSEVRVSPSYLNSFFLTTCFLLFIGFRCNILLTNIYIDLLLLALLFLKNFNTFNKRYSKFIICYNINCRLVLDYIFFFSLSEHFL